MTWLSGKAGLRGAAVALSLLALVACSAVPDSAPAVVTPGGVSGSGSGSGSFMTSPATDAPVVTRSTVPTGPATTSTPAITPSATASTTSDPGGAESTATTTPLIERPGTGTVVYRGTTYVAETEETTKILATSVTVDVEVSDSAGSEERAAARAYEAAIELSNSAYRTPSKDWDSRARKVMTSPYLERFLDDVAFMRDADLHAIGNIVVSGQLVEITRQSAVISACIDTSQREIVDAGGSPVSAGNSAKYKVRYASVAEMKLETSGWKIVDTNDRRDQQC